MANPNKKPSPAKTALLKKGVGLTNQGQQGSVCPKCSQPIGQGEMVNYSSGGMETHMQCPASSAQQPGQQNPGWQSRLNLPPGYKPKQQPTHTPGMINPNVGKPTASVIATVRTERKMAGRPPRFSFAVPTQAAGHVAFQLAKAGMKDFEVTHYSEDEVSNFEFASEPEMHVAEEIVKAEFVDQIAARKGAWAMWADTLGDPAEIKGERELEHQKQYVSSQHEIFAAREQGKVAGTWGERSYDSDQVHDVLDAHRRGDDEQGNQSFDDPVPQEAVDGMLAVLDRAPDTDESVYLGVVVFLVTHGSQVPALYRDRARRIAFELVQDENYLNEWNNPALRKVELEHEIELLEGVGKTALLLPEDLKYLNLPAPKPGQGMSDAEVKKMDAYRNKKLLAWIDELGLDLSAELKQYEEGDFWTRDRIYEEVRDMIKEERKFQGHYRRTMRGPRPYNRQPRQ